MPKPIGQFTKVVGVIGLALTFLLAFAMGKGARDKTQANMSSRLELTRKRFQNCDRERILLKGGTIDGVDELTLTRSEHEALISENELLREDNEDLKRENDEQERQLDVAAEDQDTLDFVSDDDVQELEETMASGNNSAALVELLDDLNAGGIDKDTLIERLLKENDLKRKSRAKCFKRKKVLNEADLEKRYAELIAANATIAKSLKQWKPARPWVEMNKKERRLALKMAELNIALLQAKGSTSEADALLQKWGPRHPDGLTVLKQEVGVLNVKQRQKELWGKEEEEDWDNFDFGWDEWEHQNDLRDPKKKKEKDKKDKKEKRKSAV
eukprot:NODE_2750_length_1103_cov_31.073770_g2625_i0.p1 GENE.NODE_2750_length_1103_cov_31.073770_g2625_i0~~NODE_2750_length_1103_cov_31.073770_g2625_i0.p1  ORF type:complete len:344 (+),score=140.71 NODE_2750_length_1103_cov_31.073770_g2625_i0:52-1032(+)